MKDRNVQHASRFRLTKVPGTDDVYDLIPAPGEVYEEGTLINKSALLKDATAALFGLGADAVPDEVLALLKTITDNQSAAIANGVKVATGSYVGTGTYGSKNPCSLTFDFKPKLIFMWQDVLSSKNGYTLAYSMGGTSKATYIILPLDEITENYTEGGMLPIKAYLYYYHNNGNQAGQMFYGYTKLNNNILSWYLEPKSTIDQNDYKTEDIAFAQLNSTNTKYKYLIVG